MKKLLKLLLLPVLCTFFLLQAQKANAQSNDNDVLVMEYGAPAPMNSKCYGLYVFWPDKEVEFTALPPTTKLEEMIANKVALYKKINELSDLGWELYFVDTFTYFFKRATPK